MPILTREADFFPPTLWETISHDEHTWYAVYTRSRREKDLMRRLAAMGISFYGPCAQKKSRSPSGRVRESWVPLFSNYVFVRGDGEDVARSRTTNCVSRVIEVPDPEALSEDLRQISHLIHCDQPIQIENQIVAGDLVRIKSGPFRGCEGTVVKRRGRSRLVVAVRFLQQGASVQLDDFSVERL